MAWKIPFMSTSGTKYRIEISGGDGTLKAAAQPFVLDQDDDDDLFTPVRTVTGYITVVCTFDEISDIVSGTSPKDRTVELLSVTEETVDDYGGEEITEEVTTVLWQGYLRCETFDFDYTPFVQEFQIPICNNLEYIQNKPIDKGSLNMLNLNKWFDEFTSCYDFIYTPAESQVLWSMRIDKANYLSERDTADADGNMVEMDSYGTFLEDFCNLMGWQCQESGRDLIFTSNDNRSSYYKWELHPIVHTYDLIETVTREQLNLPDIVSDSNSASIIPGKKSVKVETQVNPYNESIFSFNEDRDLDFSGGYAEAFINISANEKYRTRGVQTGLIIKGHQYKAGTLTEVSVNNIKFQNAKAKSRVYEGGSLANEIIYGGSSNVEDNFEKEWHTRILLCNSTFGNINTPLIEVTPILPVAQSVYAKIVVKCTAINCCDDADDLIDDSFTGSVVGYLYSDAFTDGRAEVSMLFEDGKLKTNTWDINWGSIEGSAVDWNKNDISRTSFPITYKIFYVKNANGDMYDGYVSLEDLTISVIYVPWATYGKDDTNSYYKELGSNFQDDVSVTCGLTWGKYGQIGKGCIGGNTVITRRPEEYLGERMANYYSKSHEKFTFVVRGTEYINPINTVMINGIECAIIGQSLDYRYEELTLTLLSLT